MKLPALREIVEERKEKAIESLSDSYAKNHLPLEEYERLVEYINKIESERELVVVEKMVSEYAADQGEGETSAKPVYDNSENKPDYPHYASSSTSLTALSSRTVSGPIKSGSQFATILGSTNIKIRREDLHQKQTFLQVVTILGDNTISVESGIRVMNQVIPILGSAETNHKVDKQAMDGWPELIITGTALLGNITVKLLKE